LEEKYYYDTTLKTFKLCSYEMPNCEFCSTYGEFQCKRCFINYSFKHENNIVCSEKTLLEGNKFFILMIQGLIIILVYCLIKLKIAKNVQKKIFVINVKMVTPSTIIINYV